MTFEQRSNLASIAEVALPAVIGALIDGAPVVIGAIAASEILLGICVVGTFVVAAVAVRKLF
jgi:hypothetical protein